MAKLRHITLSVDDMEKTATFYEQAFEMKRVRQSNVAIMMSDGVVSLAIIDANKNANSGARTGLHHMGFLVDNIDEAAAKVEKSGGTYAGQIKIKVPSLACPPRGFPTGHGGRMGANRLSPSPALPRALRKGGSLLCRLLN